ncbi:MAG: Kynurenine formamidase, partial [uncultured Rubrobacteraceae bacterium]
ALQGFRNPGRARRPVRPPDAPPGGGLPLRGVLRAGEREGPPGPRPPPERALRTHPRRARGPLPGGEGRAHPRLRSRRLLGAAHERGVRLRRARPRLQRRIDRGNELRALSGGHDRRDRPPDPRRRRVGVQERPELRRRPRTHPRRRALRGRSSRRHASRDGLGRGLRAAGRHHQGRDRHKRALRPRAVPLHLSTAEGTVHVGSGQEEQPHPPPPGRRPSPARRLRRGRDGRVRAPVGGLSREVEGEGPLRGTSRPPRQEPLRHRRRLPRRRKPAAVTDIGTDGLRI